MSNEELAIRIQAGENDLLCDLWTQVEKWIRYQAGKYHLTHQDRCSHLGVTAEDLYQSGFFALLKAIEAYEVSKGLMFITYLRYPLKNEFDKLTKSNGRICKKDVLDGSLSLDMPINSDYENKNRSLADLVIDPSSQSELDNAINSDCEIALQIALQKAIEKLPERYQKVVEGRYLKNEKPASLMAKLGISRTRVWVIQDSAIKALAKSLADFREDFISREEYRGGYAVWYHTGMSLQERIVVELDRRSIL